MRSFAVEFTASAEADFAAIQDHIAAQNPMRALTFIDELRDAAVALLSTSPNAGAPIGRYRYLARGNYVVVYRVDERLSKVFVMLVTEGHRNWRPSFED